MSWIGRTISKWFATPVPTGSGGWMPTVHEPYTGAWQQNMEWKASDVLAYHAVYACITRIAQDIGKLRIKLVEQDANRIWREITSPAFSPVLRRPNRYQNHIQFKEHWLASKLFRGNTYILKERDSRNVVTALYILHPDNVTPMVTPDGGVYYQLKRDELAGVAQDQLLVPASEIIHDRMNCLFHPLVGVSPIYASGTSAAQGFALQKDASNFAENGSMPGGFLTAPGRISDETAQRLKAKFDTGYTGANRGKIAVLGDGLKFEPVRMSAADAQVIEQLKMTAEVVCSAFHVPAHMVGVGAPPPYGNTEQVDQRYYSQCLQSHIEAMELCLDEGLNMPSGYGTELDLDGLIRMDTASKIEALKNAVGAGVMAPNEARLKLDLSPVEGGETPYLQQQNFSLQALARRDEQPAPGETPAEPQQPTEPETSKDLSIGLIQKLAHAEAIEATT